MSESSPPRNVVDRLRWLWRIWNRLEALSLRVTGTSGAALVRGNVLVLETTGRRTGKRRHTPVAYWIEGDDHFVGGGAAGMTRVDWVANIRANPDAAIWLRRRRMQVRVHELLGSEYETARTKALKLWPHAAKYEARSGRRIPFFRLSDPHTSS